ncbi:MAG TPA: carboxypeptidase-like regulatory domain-containing protein, partial [Sphingobacterium sp.]|nr:carboxypeptidase-like regulatory domain-containing protein [Sphingobacterium sp.]
MEVLYAQTKVQGVLIDSTYNTLLSNVSVSLYEKDKKTVDKVTLTDRFGKFILEEIPPGKPMLIEFSFVGYQKTVREFVLKQHEQKNFGHIHMPFVETEIEAVEVIPPIRMNGDTLEFNADAFQLDTNAVVEDLLRKLPGLVVWGDGAVTYNGRDIPSVLVNGKPFFGNDMSIALQNIQKDAVKKIQVYDRRDQEKQREDPDDKQYEMNVVLKEGRERLYFG